MVAAHVSGPSSVRAASSSAAASESNEPPVQLLSDGTMRVLQLNRPRVLNAINEEMIDIVRESLDRIEASPDAGTVLFRGAGRAICAGGDIMTVVKLADSEKREDHDAALRFFAKELVEDYRIHKLHKTTSALGHPKTFIGLWDGITMGGGVGMSVHAPVRIATERTLFAMPETAIGYTPDVGVMHTFARMDGETGTYLALTGNHIGGADTYLTGLATHYVSSSVVQDLVQRIAALPLESASRREVVVQCIDEFASDPFEADPAALQNSPFLGDRRIAMDLAFGRDTVEQIVLTLDDIAQRRSDSFTGKEMARRGVPTISDTTAAWAKETHDTLLNRSPRALKVSLRGIRCARHETFVESMHSCLVATASFCDFSLGRDFHTGVFHMLSKDPATGKRRTGRPAWNPARLEDVSDESVRNLFFCDAETAYRSGLQLRVPTLEGMPPLPRGRDARRIRDAELRGIGPLHWQPKHNPHALPSEAECAALADGSHPAAGSYVLEPEELIDTLARHKLHKPSLRLKVADWLDRRARST